jgi:hypothetical protein
MLDSGKFGKKVPLVQVFYITFNFMKSDDGIIEVLSDNKTRF